MSDQPQDSWIWPLVSLCFAVALVAAYLWSIFS
jgi:hypothetical protein